MNSIQASNSVARTSQREILQDDSKTIYPTAAIPAVRTIEEFRECRSLIARSFSDDPFVIWTFPENETRVDCVGAIIGASIEPYFQNGRIDICKSNGQIVAVAIWDNPPTTPPTDDSVPKAGGLLQAMIGKQRTDEVSDAYVRLAGLRPTSPHCYLHYLAVDPRWQRMGLGRDVITPGLLEAAELGIPIYLETNNPDSIPFYRSLGFLVCTETQLPHGSPLLWTLIRSA